MGKRFSAVLVALTAIAGLAHAGMTDLSDSPLANVNGTTAVKPNILFMLDDSGSMQQFYTPDYVSEIWNTPTYQVMHCYNSGDSDQSSARDLCLIGDPPYMSADFNKQYYNPAITYRPAVNADGSSKPSQSRDNTSAWTQVASDGFGAQKYDQFYNATNTINLVAGYPERIWCHATSDAAAECKTNSSGYVYPDSYYNRGQDGLGRKRYAYGPPYYFTINAGEYCTDEALTNCTAVALGAMPPSGYVFPAKVRWCDSTALTNCQAKKIGAFQYVKYSTTSAAAIAYGTIQIGNSGSTDSVRITNVQVNGVNIINTTITAANGTSSSANRTAMANGLAAAINSHSSDPEYIACAGSACSSYGLGSTASDTVVVIPTVAPGSSLPITDNSRAGFPIAVSAPVNNIAASTGSVTVGNSGNGSGTVSSIKVNGVEVLNGGLANFGANSNSNRTAAAIAIKNRINAYLNANPWEYTARSNVNGTPCKGGNVVCVDAPLAAGSAPNGLAISYIASGGVTLSSTAMTGGVSRYVPTAVTNISAGMGATSTFSRVNIVSTTATYPAASTRSDCVTTPGVCTYDEEMTNFANWYAYYKTRMQTMKTAAGRAFANLSSDYRVGFNTINGTDVVGNNSKFMAIKDFNEDQRSAWYSTFYANVPSGSTPLRTALDRAGKLYSGNYVTTGDPACATHSASSCTPDPMQYSCQQNFTILTTDGYWNENYSGVGDQDNVTSTFCTRENGCYDGNLGAANTLADVALHYYKTDLRPTAGTHCTGSAGVNVCFDNVPATNDAKDPSTAQHMVTFTMGLGVDGTMTYRDDYARAATGDFYKIKAGLNGCDWTSPAFTATCNWPVPVSNTQTAVDDLWHAAVNGHGLYFSAKDAAAVSNGLNAALNNLKVRNGAAAASATSAPNISYEDNDIFSTAFRTVNWDGEVTAQKIDPESGTTLSDKTWTAAGQLDAKVSDDADTRVIYTLDSSGPSPALKAFDWAALTPDEQALFADKCSGANPLSQCSTLGLGDQTTAGDGANMVAYLRGRQAMEVAGIYRSREHVLGDIASAKPAYVTYPRRGYVDAGYAQFKASYASRQPMVYAAANDGMVHAFNAATGEEMWAYVPKIVTANMYHLADLNYATNHRYFVDGSPESGDIYADGAWKTILVGGLNKGGRGYYALDITDPAAPRALWEICSDATCAINDADFGYSYGNPIITKRPADGKWVVLVTSGYNNVSPGTGRGYLFVLDAATGAILEKVDTGVGSTSSPSGLAKISSRADNPQADNTSTLVYGGDLMGNLWRFSLPADGAELIVALKLAQLNASHSSPSLPDAPQPITARPELGDCNGKPMVFIGTGELLGLSDLSTSQRQTIYGVLDQTTSYGNIRTANLVQQTLQPLTGNSYTISNNVVDLTQKRGWFVDLDRNVGERINLDPKLVLGTLVTVANQPNSISACSIGGTSYQYQLNYCTGSYVQNAPNGQAGALLAQSSAVGFIVIRLSNGKVVSKTRLSDGGEPQLPVNIAGSTLTRRVSWREITNQ